MTRFSCALALVLALTFVASSEGFRLKRDKVVQIKEVGSGDLHLVQDQAVDESALVEEEEDEEEVDPPPYTVFKRGSKQMCKDKIKGGCTCGGTLSSMTDNAKRSAKGANFVSVWPRDANKGGGYCFRYSKNCNSKIPLTSSSQTATIYKKSR